MLTLLNMETMMDFNTCIRLESGNIRSPKIKLTFPYLLTPNPKAKKKDRNGQEYLSYTTGVLIPPTADIGLLKTVAKEKAIEEFGSAAKIKEFQDRGKWNSPFLDAFQKSQTDRNPAGDAWMKGWTLLRISSKSKPGVVDRFGNNVDDEAEVYGGRWAFVTLAPHAYPSIDGGKPGVGFWLQNVQLLDHDEPLGGGRVAASAEFAPVELPEDGASEGASADSVFGDQPAGEAASVDV